MGTPGVCVGVHVLPSPQFTGTVPGRVLSAPLGVVHATVAREGRWSDFGAARLGSDRFGVFGGPDPHVRAVERMCRPLHKTGRALSLTLSSLWIMREGSLV